MYTRQLPAGGVCAGTAASAGTAPGVGRASTMGSACTVVSACTMSISAAGLQPCPVAPAYICRPVVPTNSSAIVGMVPSIAAFSFAPAAIVGIVLGHIARGQIRRSGERGDGMAIAALWIGYLLSFFCLLFFIVYFGLFALAIGLEMSAT